MIIQHSISAINSYRDLGINQSTLSKNLEKLSSGYKINRAGDNAAGLAISRNMKSQIDGLNQTSANARDVIGLVKTAEGAPPEIYSVFQRMTTLAEQATNGTYNTVARGSIQEGYKTLTKEAKRISENADFNGIRPLTAGEEMAMAFQIGPTSGEAITVDKEDIYSKTIATTMSLRLSIQNDTKNAPKTVKTVIDDVSTYRAKLGVAQNRLEHTVENLNVMFENTIEAESHIHDTDMADGITAFTKGNILLQAAQSVLTQSNAAPQGILNLLQ